MEQQHDRIVARLLDAPGRGVRLAAASVEDGELIASYAIDALPVFDGLAAANGSLYLALRDGTVRCFGQTGEALESKLGSGQATDPGFAHLEEYIVDTLDETERVRLKLANPLGVGNRLIQTYLAGTEGRLDLLRDDFSALDTIERQLDHYAEDMDREFRFRLSDVDTILHEFELRGQEYFDETLRLPRAFDLLNKAKTKSDFERHVVGDTPQRIE